MNISSLPRFASPVLRMGLGFVFIYFGLSGILHVDMWTSLVPAWTAIIAPASTLVILHGGFELLFGILLFSGFFVRIASGLLFLNLVHIITLLEPGAVMARDIAIAMALLSVLLQGDESAPTVPTSL